MKPCFAVIGHPIGHTMSPFIHNRLFALSGMEADYITLDILPENLENEIQHLKQLKGFNVTIPHKEKMFGLINNADESASKYKATNCVSVDNGRTTGYSTDAYGFLMALKTEGIALSGKVLVLGCGGAATTLATEAATLGCDITIAVRSSSLKKAENLKQRLENHNVKVDVVDIANIKDCYNLLVNATPVGMYPNVEQSPVDSDVISRCEAVFDAVYNPEETKLIKQAKSLKVKAVGGMPMLVWQAVKSHEYWYGGKFKPEDITKLIADTNKEMVRIFYEK